MLFKDRTDAGRQLATRLSAFCDKPDTLVLGIPRGGVPVAYEIASALHAPLDIFLSRKLGVPGNEELAFGAVAADDGQFLDDGIVRAARITPEQIAEITARTRQILEERAILYREGRSPLAVEDKTVILVDDGIATGASMYAAMQALKQMKPRALVVAVPVAPLGSCAWLEREADSFFTVYAPKNFFAVGQFYCSFGQTPDEEVADLLRRASQDRPEKSSFAHRPSSESPG